MQNLGKKHLGWLFAFFLVITFAAQAAEIHVHYDTGYGNFISIRGDSPSLSWNTGSVATWTDDDTWVLVTPEHEGGFEFKPLLNDQNWSTGSNYYVATGHSTVHIYPFFGPAQGTLSKIPNFYSQHLDNWRTLRIYLPPSYDENLFKRYPVLYMHDGQNLFEARTSFGGVEWQVDETMDALIGTGEIAEAIVVGIDNNGDRLDEYTPMPDPEYGGGNGDAYLDFIEEEIIPHIDANYRTQTGVENTMIMGSSLGGLISFYAVWTRGDAFSAAGCISSSFWWNNEALTTEVEHFTGNPAPVRIYMDIGGLEGAVNETRRMYKAVQDLGYREPEELMYVVAPSGQHNEASWAERIDIPLRFLLGN